MITYFQALVLGFLQGVTELFPISSLGHSVLLAWLFGWHNILANESKHESFFLSFLVILHVATAIALFIFYRKIWWRIITAFFKSVSDRKIASADGRLAWLLIIATIPAGLVALIFESLLRAQFAKPLAAMIFLILNGFILLAGDYHQRHHPPRRERHSAAGTAEQVTRKLTFTRAAVIGVAQVAALCAGISRSGITMVAGMYSGLNNEDAARFSFLLATPIIFAAGFLKLPDFFKPMDAGSRMQILAGGVAAGIGAYLAVRFLDRYFQKKGLRPFALYCICAGVFCIGLGLIRGNL